jgi:hypothetical protein
MQSAPGLEDMARRVGRPSKAKDDQAVPVPVRFPQQLLDRVDALVDARPDGAMRSQVIREATAIGLDVLEARFKGRK